MNLDPQDEITGSEDEINYDEVVARLKVLRPFHVEDTRVQETAVADPTVEACVSREDGEAYIAGQPNDIRPFLEVVEYGDESEELEALRDLKAEMDGHTGGQADSVHVVAVADGHLEDFVRDRLEDIYGEEAIGSVASHADWGAVAAEHATDMTATEYRGSSYYITT